MNDSRKRRSDRLMVSIPVRVSGVTETGEAFERSGHAVEVNRFGAHIQMEKPVQASPKVLLTNLKNNLRRRVPDRQGHGELPGGDNGLRRRSPGELSHFLGDRLPGAAQEAQ